MRSLSGWSLSFLIYVLFGRKNLESVFLKSTKVARKERNGTLGTIMRRLSLSFTFWGRSCIFEKGVFPTKSRLSFEKDSY